MTDVQERHDQIRQLEASMLELHQVFSIFWGTNTHSTLCSMNIARQQIAWKNLGGWSACQVHPACCKILPCPFFLNQISYLQVFLDMSILVADQGDTINSIDNWVTLLCPFHSPLLLPALISDGPL